MEYLKQLAEGARPIDDFDLGSARQIGAETDFFDALDLAMSGRLTQEETEAFDSFYQKATADERISEGLRLAAIALAR